MAALKELNNVTQLAIAMGYHDCGPEFKSKSSHNDTCNEMDWYMTKAVFMLLIIGKCEGALN